MNIINQYFFKLINFQIILNHLKAFIALFTMIVIVKLKVRNHLITLIQVIIIHR